MLANYFTVPNPLTPLTTTSQHEAFKQTRNSDNSQQWRWADFVSPRKWVFYSAVRRAWRVNEFHTDAIQERLIPAELPKEKISLIYATEADLLNTAMFGMTAKEWRESNPDKKGNIRDAATLEQLVVLSNLESINAMLIHQELSQKERIKQLNYIAITQMTSLLSLSDVQKRLKKKND